MGSLNESQKQQLKAAQRQWIKQRDAFVSQNPGNPQGALYQATMQRVAELMNKMDVGSKNTSTTAIETENKSNSNTETVIQQPHHVTSLDDYAYLNSVYLKENDIIATTESSGNEVKIWERKTGKLLRTIPIGMPVDLIFPSENKGNIIVLNFWGKWNEGRGAWSEYDATTGNLLYQKCDVLPDYRDIYKFCRMGLCKNMLWFIRAKNLKSYAGSSDKIGNDDEISLIIGNNNTGININGFALLKGKNINDAVEGIVTYHDIDFIDMSNEDNVYLGVKNVTLKISLSQRTISKVKTIEPYVRNSYGLDPQDLELMMKRPRDSTPKQKIGVGLPKAVKGINFSNSSETKLYRRILGEQVAISFTDKPDTQLIVAEINSSSNDLIGGSIGDHGRRILVSFKKSIIGINLPDIKKDFSYNLPVKTRVYNPILSRDAQAFCYTLLNEDTKSIVDWPIIDDPRGLSGKTILSTWDNPKNAVLHIDNSVIQGYSKFNDTLLISSDDSIFSIDFKNEPKVTKYAQKIESNNILYPINKYKYRSVGNYPDFTNLKNQSNSFVIKDFILGKADPIDVIGNIEDGSEQNFGVRFYDVDIADNGRMLLLRAGKGVGGLYLKDPESLLLHPIQTTISLPNLYETNIGSTSARWITNNRFYVSSSERVSIYNNGALVNTWNAPVIYPHGPFPGVDRWSFDAGSNLFSFASQDGFVRLLKLIDNSSFLERVRIAFNKDAIPIFITPENYYASHALHSDALAFTEGVHSYPLEQFDLRLNRPDIVLDRLGAPKEAVEAAKTLREKRLKRMGVTEEMLKPDFHLPELQIVGDVPATTAKYQLDLQVKATDEKYPLDRLRVYVNNVPINGTEGESLRDQKTQTLEKSISIKLAAGRNKIQVSILNSAGAESLYANAEVNCTAERPKPKLYAVALGVSQYDRPEWCLKYAAKDATDLIDKLKAKAGSSYSEVKPLLLTDKEVTKESAAKIKEFLSGATIDDTVLIFMAGHGLLDDKYDYYFGTADIDPAKPSERGIPYDAIDTILAEVPSLKKALLMDTCHAGELDDDEKKELASSDGKGTLPGGSSTATDSAIKGTVAMRAIGTRGMTVKAVEGAKGKSDWYEKLQDMFVDLRRGSGATVISSSQGAEYAFESSEQSNGLFTYALMEALDGKATPNKDGQITISAIGDYVKKRVQDLTKGKQNPNFRGVNLEEDFVLGAVR
jgi:hypothetical protein